MNPLYTLAARITVSLLVIFIFGAVIFALFLRVEPISAELKEVLLFLLGALTTSFVGVVGYWLGTTQGSAEKTQLLARAAPLKDDTQ